MLECSGHLWSVRDVRWLTMHVGAEVCEPQQVWGDAHYWLMENLASKCQLNLSIWTVGEIKKHWWKNRDIILQTKVHVIKAMVFPVVMYGSEKSMAPHSSTLAWKIPWTEEPGGLQSMGLLRVGHDWATSLWLFTFMHWRRKWQPTPVFLPGESQGRGSPVSCRLWGRTESDTTEVT